MSLNTSYATITTALRLQTHAKTKAIKMKNNHSNKNGQNLCIQGMKQDLLPNFLRKLAYE
jgi:hypothetical protein